ncbi:MAG TPA: sensor histidine kinase [Nocardioides sp.]|nr:sensor histidine kinase [Nocardioides sp.]
MAATHPDRAPWRLGPQGRRWFDTALAGALLLPVLGFPLAGYPTAWIPLTIAQVAPLLWRRRHPVPVFAIIAAAHAVQVLLYDHTLWGQVALPIALYSVARYSTALLSAGALAVSLVGATLAAFRWLEGYGDGGSSWGVVSYLLPLTTIVVTAWALGTLGRVRRAYVDTLVERGERIEREAAQQVELAALDERARIAREMHDVVAHGLTVMVVQADGARYAAGQDPAAAERALEAIAVTGRDALADMRRLLGLLRSDDTGTAPAPRLAEIADLVTDVSADLRDLDTDVPPAVALTAYRVVQESLSNVRKHAGPDAHAHVSLRVDDVVHITVEDDGRGATAPDDGLGHGLRGMSERVAVHAGDLEAGPRPGGGFRVAARIPR